jgi:hypothetical protein
MAMIRAQGPEQGIEHWLLRNLTPRSQAVAMDSLGYRKHVRRGFTEVVLGGGVMAG